MLFSAKADKIEPIDKLWIKGNYTKYEYRIPMRDGIALHTAVFCPKDVSTNYPILLTRTPYSVSPYGVDHYPEPKGLLRLYARERFIFALQDVRGRLQSDGEFVHMRPILPKKTSPKDVDESTDAWDTIDWLVKNIPGNNGRVGLSGVSYPGFYASSGAIDSHPALAAVSPQAPITDWFIGDDFHHNGAFFLPHTFSHLPIWEPKAENPRKWKILDAIYDDYDTPNGYEFYLSFGPLVEAGNRYYKNQVQFWNDLVEHPDYDGFWRARNLRPHLKNISAAVLTVGGWFDAENLFGALETFRSIERQNPGITNILVMGPWSHGQWHSAEGKQLGHLDFRSSTAAFFQTNIELPFFNYLLKGRTNFVLSKAIVFETGTCQWRRYDTWPPKNTRSVTLNFHRQGKLTTNRPAASPPAFDEYVSDPAKPVPFIPNIAVGMTPEYMVDDQRFAAMRPDVMVYQTDVLEEDLVIAGPITSSLHVSTSGTDSDWIVKLIDVYPGDYPDADPNPARIRMGGYQQLVRAEVMRGKYRNSFENPEPFEPGQPTKVEWTMPDAYHSFRRGHRIMVHVQSTWFPLIDRNPQKFCNIYRAKPDAFQKATQRVFREVGAPSSISFPVLTSATGE